MEKERCLLIDVVDNVDFGDESWAFNFFDFVLGLRLEKICLIL